MTLLKIENLNSEVIYEGYADNKKALLEEAVREGANLSRGNFTNWSLVEASLDGGQFTGASFAGANLLGANMSECLLNDCDFQNARLSDACLAYSSLDLSDFDGTSFTSGTMVTGADLSSCYFNCSSIFSVKLREALTLSNCVYSHLDITDCPISQPPIVVCGLPHHLVFMDNHLKINSEVKTHHEWMRMDETYLRMQYGEVVCSLIRNNQFFDTTSQFKA